MSAVIPPFSEFLPIPLFISFLILRFPVLAKKFTSLNKNLQYQAKPRQTRKKEYLNWNFVKKARHRSVRYQVTFFRLMVPDNIAQITLSWLPISPFLLWKGFFYKIEVFEKMGFQDKKVFTLILQNFQPKDNRFDWFLTSNDNVIN